MRTSVKAVGAVTLLLAALGSAGAAVAGPDDGNDERSVQAERGYGVAQGLAASSTLSLTKDQASANPLALATLAKGLKAKVVTSGVAARNLDMGALWPIDDPKYLVYCNEQSPTDPGVQLISLADGSATTVLTGTQSCDALHTTPWGTVAIGEERADGHVWEILDPTKIDVTVDRATGVVTGQGADLVARRDALGSVAYEGLGFLRSGVAYYGDELGPKNGAPGGAYYKFLPSTRWNGSPVTSLAQSPLVSGTVYGLKVGSGSNTGQGMQLGDASWVQVDATAPIRPQTTAKGLTGYYRPEDLSFDRKAMAQGTVRFCGNNTGREQAHFYGETNCITDGTLAQAASADSKPRVDLLVAGSPAFNSPDNIAHQPGRGNWIVHEDGETTFEGAHNNDLWSCRPDGMDADLQSDGCLRVATLNDLTAEWTGGFFDPSGKHFYVSIQHNITGKGVVLDITGWR